MNFYRKLNNFILKLLKTYILGKKELYLSKKTYIFKPYLPVFL